MRGVGDFDNVGSRSGMVREHEGKEEDQYDREKNREEDQRIVGGRTQ